MRPFRLPAAVLTVALSCMVLGCGPPAGSQKGETVPKMDDSRLVGATSQEKGPEGRTLSASMPAEDVRGEPVPGLPRHPGSVRTGYSESRKDGLVLVLAAYLAEEKPGAVSGFYRDSFRSGGWEVANVEYSDGWRFLVLCGRREAEVTVSRRGGGSEVEIELSRPARVQEGAPSAGGSKR